MRKNFITVTIFALAAVLLGGCNPAADVAVPEIKMPEIPDVGIELNKLFACSKEEASQKLTDEALENVVSIEDTVEIKDLEYVNCDGSVTKTSRGPVRFSVKPLPVNPPIDFAEDVTSVAIENERTCSSTRISTSDKEDLKSEVELPNGEKISLDPFASVANKSGELIIVLTNRELKSPIDTNVVDGLNMIRVKYYGKCLEYKADSEETPENCIRENLLGTKDIVVDYKVSFIEKEDVETVDMCKNESGVEEI